MIKVLIVEDSLSVRLLLRRILESDSRLQVVQAVGSGEEAIEYLSRTPRPEVDVITMDIEMPGMDGYTATRRIMERTPLPIVVVSSAYKPDEAQHCFEAIDAGAVALVEKPVGIDHRDFELYSKGLIHKIVLMSEVKVVTHFSRNRNATDRRLVMNPEPRENCGADILAIGSSTGGPPGLFTLLSDLPQDFPLPILVVQHISEGFLEGMAGWLQQGTGFPVHIPMDGDVCLPGHVYLAPDNYHMGIAGGRRIVLDKGPLENNQRPSVSFLFRSAAKHFSCNSVAVLLSGMGNDGAWELKELRNLGSSTIVQDEASCVVFGMPGEAVRLGAAVHVLPPEKMAARILEILHLTQRKKDKP